MELIKKLCFIFILTLSFSSHSLEIDLMNAPMGDFIRISQDNLPYTVAYDESAQKLVSFKAVVSADDYQSFFESVVYAFGYELRKVGSVRRLELLSGEVAADAMLYTFKHADSASVLAPLSQMMGAFGRELVLKDIHSINAISISGDPTVFHAFERLAKQLDMPTSQIEVEAVLFETSYKHMKSLGIEVSNTSSGLSFDVGSSVSEVGNLALSFATGNFTAFVNAAESDTNISILSRPNVRMRSGTGARIQVGADVPLITGSVRQEDGQIYQTITRADVGLILDVKARSAGEVISLDINQDITDVVRDAQASDLVFSKQTMQTSLDVKPGEMISIGGLISSKQSITDRSVPYISSIPLIGGLFGHDSDSDERKILALFVTAKLV